MRVPKGKTMPRIPEMLPPLMVIAEELGAGGRIEVKKQVAGPR